MPFLKYALILCPAVAVGVFAYCRTLLWIGETVSVKWLRWTFLMIVYLGFVVIWFLGTFFLIDAILPFREGDSFFIGLVMSCAVMMVTAFLSHRRYRSRLDAVGILFSSSPKT